jgi:hypothetical protein
MRLQPIRPGHEVEDRERNRKASAAYAKFAGWDKPEVINKLDTIMRNNQMRMRADIPDVPFAGRDYVPQRRELSREAYEAARAQGPRPMPSGYRGMRSWGERENDRIARMNPDWYDEYGKERRDAGGATLRPFDRGNNGPRFGGGRGMDFYGRPPFRPRVGRRGSGYSRAGDNGLQNFSRYWNRDSQTSGGPQNLGQQPFTGGSAPLPRPDFSNMPPQPPLQGGPAQNRFRNRLFGRRPPVIGSGAIPPPNDGNFARPAVQPRWSQPQQPRGFGQRMDVNATPFRTTDRPYI